MASQLQMEGAPDHKIVLVNAQRLDFDQRLNFTKLALRGVVERHYEDAPTDDQRNVSKSSVSSPSVELEDASVPF